MKEKLLKDVKQGLCRCGHVMEYHLNLDPAYEKCKYVKGSEEITKEKDVYKRVKKIYCGCEKYGS